jgi:predicted Zn-dependent peptidase
MSEPPVWFDGDAPHLRVSRRTLACGLDVVVHRDPSAAMACASVWYRVGSTDERADRTGLAHLFEHLFKNSAHMPARHYEVLRLAGATDANASTSADRTAYHEVVPAHQLALALWLESDRMGYFADGAAADAALADRLATQQQVVRSERRQRYEDVPYGAERFALAAALYPEGHPQRHLTIGRHDDIAAATVDDVLAFYRTWYVPANATLVVAGDIGDADEAGAVDELVDRYFGTFPASTRPARRVVAQPVVHGPVVVEVVDPFATLPRIHRVWHGPAATGDDEAELDVLTTTWAQPGTGTLWRRLVYDEQIAQRVSAWVASTRLGGEVHVAVDARPGVDLARLRGALDDELDRVVETDAITRAMTRREANAVWGLTALARRAQLLQRFVLYRGEPDGLAGELARYRAVTPAGIATARLRWLDRARMVEVVTVPATRATG